LPAEGEREARLRQATACDSEFALLKLENQVIDFAAVENAKIRKWQNQMSIGSANLRTA
jgi:hypothetical protein